MSRLAARRSFVGVLAVLIVVLLVAGAFAAATPTPTPTSKAKARTAETETEGVHGGPKPRFHDAATCNLTSVASLEGNWTHGDYVSAVAKLGDPEKTKAAAHSRCGKKIKTGGSAKPARAGKPARTPAK